MEIKINSSDSRDPTVLDITNIRTFQHLALLVDRPDFIEDVKNLRPIVLAKSFVTLKSALDQYLPDTPVIPEEIYTLLSKYHYPSTLAPAIHTLFIKNIITDKEVEGYGPQVGRPKSKLRGYISHQFDFRLDKKIKTHRNWYLLYRKNFNPSPGEYLGVRKISKIVHCPHTTVHTAIASYRNKLRMT